MSKWIPFLHKCESAGKMCHFFVLVRRKLLDNTDISNLSLSHCCPTNFMRFWRKKNILNYQTTFDKLHVISKLEVLIQKWYIGNVVWYRRFGRLEMAARFGARNRMGRHLLLYHTWCQICRKGKSSNNLLNKTDTSKDNSSDDLESAHLFYSYLTAIRRFLAADFCFIFL